MEIKLLKCPACGASVKSDAKYCSYCSSPLIIEKNKITLSQEKSYPKDYKIGFDFFPIILIITFWGLCLCLLDFYIWANKWWYCNYLIKIKMLSDKRKLLLAATKMSEYSKNETYAGYINFSIYFPRDYLPHKVFTEKLFFNKLETAPNINKPAMLALNVKYATNFKGEKLPIKIELYKLNLEWNSGINNKSGELNLYLVIHNKSQATIKYLELNIVVKDKLGKLTQCYFSPIRGYESAELIPGEKRKEWASCNLEEKNKFSKNPFWSLEFKEIKI